MKAKEEDKLICDFLKSDEPTVADNGFSQRVMRALPPMREPRFPWITMIVMMLLVVAAFFFGQRAFSYYHIDAMQVVGRLLSKVNPTLLLHLAIAVVVIIYWQVFERLSEP